MIAEEPDREEEPVIVDIVDKPVINELEQADVANGTGEDAVKEPAETEEINFDEKAIAEEIEINES